MSRAPCYLPRPRRALLTVLGATLSVSVPSDVAGQPAGPAAAGRLHPVIALHEARLPVFGLYAPRARSGGRGGAPPVERTPEERARAVVSYTKSDFVFDGSMEGGVDAGLPAFTAFVEALRAGGATARRHPLVVKMQPIGEDLAGARDAIAKQLDVGVSTVMLVGVEDPEEVRAAVAAMRYPERGGTRPDRVGEAPAYWGVSEAEYRRRADLWPLNPEGELTLWVIIESREGLARAREIAAVEGIGVLWPGAGTLRGVFSSTGPDGRRVLDAEGWEGAIRTVLAACREFDVPCGFPANERDIETRMRQGFRVFVTGWGEAGFRTVELGWRLAGR